MRNVFCLSSVAVILAVALAHAQTYVPGGGSAGEPYYPPPYYDGYPYSYHSSTAAEGYARGMGDVIRSWGQYNLATSAAAVNLGEARKKQIENDKQWTSTYFQMRDVNRQQHEAEMARRRSTQTDWIRYVQAGKPKPLGGKELDPVTGELHWPILLTAESFAADCDVVQKLFSTRAYHGVLDAEEFRQATASIERMIATLQDRIRDVPPQQYVAAKEFLDRLAYAAGQPTG